MTKLCLDFKKSGNISEGADHAEGDDELFDGAAAIENKDFKWSKNAYLFVYLVYDRNPRQWFTAASITNFGFRTRSESTRTRRREERHGTCLQKTRVRDRRPDETNSSFRQVDGK